MRRVPTPRSLLWALTSGFTNGPAEGTQERKFICSAVFFMLKVTEFLQASGLFCRPNLVMRNALFFSSAFAGCPPLLCPEEFCHFKAHRTTAVTQLTIFRMKEWEGDEWVFSPVKLFWVMYGQSSSHTYIPLRPLQRSPSVLHSFYLVTKSNYIIYINYIIHIVLKLII